MTLGRGLKQARKPVVTKELRAPITAVFSRASVPSPATFQCFLHSSTPPFLLSPSAPVVSNQLSFPHLLGPSSLPLPHLGSPLCFPLAKIRRRCAMSKRGPLPGSGGCNIHRSEAVASRPRAFSWQSSPKSWLAKVLQGGAVLGSEGLHNRPEEGLFKHHTFFLLGIFIGRLAALS